MAYYDIQQDSPMGNVYDDPTATGGPTGIPDPMNPGYDTGGFPLSTGAPGSVPQQGVVPWDEYDPRIAHAPVPTGPQGPGPMDPAPSPDPAPTNWAGLQQSIFGTMPSVSGATPPPFEYDPFNAPGPFAPPSAQDVLFADPGFGFRRDQGTQAMQQSAAARGVLNTGGTLQDLIDYGQKAASQEYGNAFNRALGTYDENYRNSLNSYITNFGNALTKYNTNYNTQYQTPYNQLMQQYGLGMQGQNQLFNQQFSTATA